MGTITVLANPTTTFNDHPAGFIGGGGIVSDGGTASVSASVWPAWEFINWTESGVQVSVKNIYTFTASGDRTLTANFKWMPQAQIDRVDPTKILVPVIDKVNYTEFEYSYSGLTVIGGSEWAVQYAASDLLEAMDFRFYAGPEWAIVRPATIPTGLSQAKREWWISKSNRIWLSYGHSFISSNGDASWPGGGPIAQDSVNLNETYTRWAVMNGINDVAFPAGHRWSGIISNHLDWFKARPHLIKGGLPTLNEGKALYFVLDPAINDTTKIDELAHLCAADIHWTYTAPNHSVVGAIVWDLYHRSHMDPSDGDQSPSDWVFPFTKLVADKIRLGTAAIDNIPALPAVPGAQLGLYAYAGHKLPPTVTVAPSVYTQVNTQFGLEGYSFAELVELHAAKAATIGLREYWEDENVTHGMPFVGRMRARYFESYDLYHSLGVTNVNSQFNANWLTTMVGARYGIVKMKTGTGTYADALNDIMAHLFRKPSNPAEEDPKVRELYANWWGNPRQKQTNYNLRRSFDIVNEMENGWYKTLFKRYLVICKKYFYLPLKTTRAQNVAFGQAQVPPVTYWPNPIPGDPYPAAIESLASNATAMRMDEIFHSYAFLRRMVNGNVSYDYPYLWIYRRINSQATHDVDPLYPVSTTDPTWYSNPVAPTDAEFTEAHAFLLAETPHDTDLDSEDLVLVRGITPVIVGYTPELYPDAAVFNSRYTTSYAFVGPGTVIQTQVEAGTITPSGNVLTQSYGPGIHFFDTLNAPYLVSTIGGELFMDTFGGSYKDPHGPRTFHWLYVHGRSAGKVVIESNSRWSFYDEKVTPGTSTPLRFDLLAEGTAGYLDPKDLGPGQIAVDPGNTRGNIDNLSCNRWLSRKASIALLPRVIALEDFPNRARCNVI